MGLYPLKFYNVYIDKIWGGRDFELIRENIPEGSIGETIDISCYEGIMSRVKNGDYTGIDMKALISILGESLLGSRVKGDELPIMLRMVNPSEKLSIQVHPDDLYAQKKGLGCGKTEAWYVVETFDDPFVYVGTHDCDIEMFKRSVIKGDVEKYMKRYNVKRGDVFFLRSGVVHAMGHGLIMAELGQNSNTTYRICDYGRGREVDIEDALNVVDLTLPSGLSNGVTSWHCDHSRTVYFINEYFAWERLDIDKKMSTQSNSECFNAYTCVAGNCILHFENGKEFIRYGESVLIPAGLGKYSIEGRCSLLNAYVPDISSAKQEILGLVGL